MPSAGTRSRAACRRSDFAPVSQGLVAARPHVHLHVPAHDLASLQAALPRVLAALR